MQVQSSLFHDARSICTLINLLTSSIFSAEHSLDSSCISEDSEGGSGVFEWLREKRKQVQQCSSAKRSASSIYEAVFSPARAHVHHSVFLFSIDSVFSFVLHPSLHGCLDNVKRLYKNLETTRFSAAGHKKADRRTIRERIQEGESETRLFCHCKVAPVSSLLD